MIKSDSPHNPPLRTWQYLVAAFLVPYLAFLILGQAPPDLEIRKRFYEQERLFYRYFGLAQYWGMFGPGACRYNSHMTCLITLNDGTKMLWEFPRLDRLDYPDRYRLEKWRKFLTENSLGDEFHNLLPDFARWIGRKVDLPGDKPFMISYNLWTAKIPPPSDPPVPRDKMPDQANFDTRFVYEYSTDF
jgi:hypothetical protein